MKPNSPKKAGFIPYIYDGSSLLFLMMISSNPKFGGSAPMISKGGIDPGESSIAAALREANEELGLKRSNIKKHTLIEGWRGNMPSLIEPYAMVIYAAEVIDPLDFEPPHHETKETRWMTLSEFKRVGRISHVPILISINRKILAG